MTHPDGSDSADAPAPEPWYCARLLFGNYHRESAARLSYEERLILIRADDMDAAIARAEALAEDYARQFSLDNLVRYEGYCDVYHLFDAAVGDGTELYSKISYSPLQPAEFFDRFIDTPG